MLYPQEKGRTSGVVKHSDSGSSGSSSSSNSSSGYSSNSGGSSPEPEEGTVSPALMSLLHLLCQALWSHSE